MCAGVLQQLYHLVKLLYEKKKLVGKIIKNRYQKIKKH